MADTPSLFSLVIHGDVFTGTLHSPAEWNDKLAEELQLQELLIASFGHSSCCAAANPLCRVCDRPTLLTEVPAKPPCSHAVCSACLTLYVCHILRQKVTNVRCPISACRAVLVVPDAYRELIPPKLFHRWMQAHRADNWGGGRVTRVFQRGGGKWRATLSMEGFPGEKREGRDSSLQVSIQGEYDRDEFLNLAGQAQRSLGVDSNDPKGKKPVIEVGQASGSTELYCTTSAWKPRRAPSASTWEAVRMRSAGAVSASTIYVERIDGCSYVRCRCGHGFCYRCGSPMAADHSCNNCIIRSPF
ncbi:hypothetical protein OPV22_026078 [Ensete ventricosum]|uniref:RING-type domain-containing protein n=1 Tax=Ensete ventricosum TaxID=4639 RepID=A0AAV8P8Q0_ENSVE|nr:hypothetical protein OPV22_026078 [Ensete ventricosum]